MNSKSYGLPDWEFSGEAPESETSELLEAARSLFRSSDYRRVEPILAQLAVSPSLKKPSHRAEVFHMIAVVAYDRGTFNKAIKAFRRSLEIDPTFTDASVGLSIILNDLGRYDEGRQVFQEAETHLARKNFSEDVALRRRLAEKHDEIGEIYQQHKRWGEALDEYRKALAIAPRRPETLLKMVECLLAKGETGQAFKEIRQLASENPSFIPGRLKLGVMLFEAKKTADAMDQWEAVLARDPENPLAKRYMAAAREAEETLSELG